MPAIVSKLLSEYYLSTLPGGDGAGDGAVEDGSY